MLRYAAARPAYYDGRSWCNIYVCSSLQRRRKNKARLAARVLAAASLLRFFTPMHALAVAGRRAVAASFHAVPLSISAAAALVPRVTVCAHAVLYVPKLFLLWLYHCLLPSFWLTKPFCGMAALDKWRRRRFAAACTFAAMLRAPGLAFAVCMRSTGRMGIKRCCVSGAVTAMTLRLLTAAFCGFLPAILALRISALPGLPAVPAFSACAILALLLCVHRFIVTPVLSVTRGSSARCGKQACAAPSRGRAGGFCCARFVTRGSWWRLDGCAGVMAAVFACRAGGVDIGASFCHPRAASALSDHVSRGLLSTTTCNENGGDGRGNVGWRNGAMAATGRTGVWQQAAKAKRRSMKRQKTGTKLASMSAGRRDVKEKCVLATFLRVVAFGFW